MRSLLYSRSEQYYEYKFLEMPLDCEADYGDGLTGRGSEPNARRNTEGNNGGHTPQAFGGTPASTVDHSEGTRDPDRG